MIWTATGNEWIDARIRDLVNFDSGLDTAACQASPLTPEEVEAIRRKLKSFNSLFTKVAKRETKKRKK